MDGDTRTLELLWVRVMMPRGPVPVLIGALYHPPKPIYQTDILELERNVELLAREHQDALIILAGDLNQMSDGQIVEATGLVPLVHQPTRGTAVLDRLYASEECFSAVRVLTSAVKSDHRAIVAVSSGVVRSRAKTRVRVEVMRRSPDQHAALLRALSDADLSGLTGITEPQAAWDHFYAECHKRLREFYPKRKVTMTSADPPYFTPSLKLLLRRKNRLMRAGRLDEASACARRVGVEIERRTKRHLCDVDPRNGLGDLWRRVGEVTGGQRRCERNDNGLSADEFNEHYAGISTDAGYESPCLKATVHAGEDIVSESSIFYLLDHLHHTTTGYDELPAWFLRLTAPVYAGIIARLINLSVAHTHIPTQWKTSIILPIPKIQQPVTPIDYRPISITPVLSRLLERFIVHTFIYPTFDTPPLNHQLSDQFAFRPTGSTTAALISIIQQSTSLLKHEPYVSLFSFDFSKAFDTVRHSALAGKLSRIDIPDEVYNYIICFLSGRSHVTRYAGLVSGIAYINASVVQGSGFGPSSFDIVASDLHPLHQQNSLAKYADDTYLIVPASARTTVRDELDHISVWAATNNLKLNATKSRELILHRRRGLVPPASIPDVERVSTMKVLGVTLRDDLNASTHITGVLGACSRSLYALRILRSHGLPPKALHEVARSTTLSRLMYAAPAWWGLASAADRERVDRFISRTIRMGYLPPHTIDASAMVADGEDRLLAAVSSCSNHVLRPVFPPLIERRPGLRPRPHNFTLPDKDDTNFIPRVLYRVLTH